MCHNIVIKQSSESGNQAYFLDVQQQVTQFVAHLSHRVTFLSISLQPLDAAASILDGGLLGASDRSYVSQSMLFTAAACMAVLLTAQRLNMGMCRPIYGCSVSGDANQSSCDLQEVTCKKRGHSLA